MLSPQQLVSCDYWDMGCGGGNIDSALSYVSQNIGVMLEEEYPYLSGADAVSRSCLLSKSFFRPVVSVSSYWSIRLESEMRSYVKQTGPIIVQINALTWKDYVGGVVTESTCNLGTGLNHAAQAVGFTEASSRESSYWKVRNQWGASWGMSGYIYLRYRPSF